MHNAQATRITLYIESIQLGFSYLEIRYFREKRLQRPRLHFQ